MSIYHNVDKVAIFFPPVCYIKLISLYILLNSNIAVWKEVNTRASSRIQQVGKPVDRFRATWIKIIPRYFLIYLCNFYIIRYTNFKKNLKRKNKVNKQVNKNRKSFASVKEREKKNRSRRCVALKRSVETQRFVVSLTYSTVKNSFVQLHGAYQSASGCNFTRCSGARTCKVEIVEHAARSYPVPPRCKKNDRHNGVNLFIWLTTNLSSDSFADGFARFRETIAFRSRAHRLRLRFIFIRSINKPAKLFYRRFFIE